MRLKIKTLERVVLTANEKEVKDPERVAKFMSSLGIRHFKEVLRRPSLESHSDTVLTLKILGTDGI